jgi:hypothetical protein
MSMIVEQMPSFFANASQPEQDAGSMRSMAWRKALDAAGLDEALKQTRLFGPGMQPHQTTYRDGSTNEDASGSSRKTEPLSELPKRFENLQKSPAVLTDLDHTQQTVSATSQERSNPIGSVFELPHQIYQSDTLDASRTSAPSNSIQTDWQRRKISIVNAANNAADIYIRDADLDPVSIRRLLEPLKERMSVLGLSLAKVVLNGQPVWDGASSVIPISNEGK